MGAGFTLEPDLLEVGNIAARGIIRTAVFQKDVVSAVGGNLAVLPADLLNEDMTASEGDVVGRVTTQGDIRVTTTGDTRVLAQLFAVVTIEGNETFSVGDILRIKDGTDDEWMYISYADSAPTYNVLRDRGGDYAANANPAWKKGASVINYGASGEGAVYMTASETNAPYLSVITHDGDPWDTITTRARLGNLNGYLGYTSDLYGIGIGSTDGSLTYDPTNGLRMLAGQTAYNTGTGFFVGYTGGKWKLSIGDPSGDYLYWDGTNLVLNGSASLVGTLPWSDITDDGGKPDDDATAGATWGTNLASIPATLGAAGAAGLYLSSTYMGYYDSSAWKTYIDSSGNMILGAVGSGHGLSWNQTTGALSIRGSIVISAGSYAGDPIATTYTAAKNTNPLADQTSINTAANITGQGDLAVQNRGDLNYTDGADVTPTPPIHRRHYESQY